MRIIIVGAGEVGYHIAGRLAMENKDVVVIDRSAEALKRVSELSDVQTVQGSGSSPKILEQAGIRGADILLAVTDSDEINILSCFYANALAPTALKLARLRSSDYTDHRALLESDTIRINTIINPDQEVVEAVLRLMSVPGAVEINEFISGRIRLAGINLPEDSPAYGRRLRELPEIIGSLRVVVAALVRGGALVIPSGADSIRPGDTVYLVCAREDQNEVLKAFGVKEQPIRTIVIVGGGNIGQRLAQALDSKNHHVRLIDRDAARCAHLSEQLDRTIVLHGDATSQELLVEENVGELDLVVAVTGNEETNILSCLLAKSLGARKTITRVNNFGYMPLIRPIGIDHLVCPRLSAINSLLHVIRRGKVISTTNVKEEEAEVLEVLVEKGSHMAGKSVLELRFPKGALVLGFLRDDRVVIPRGDTVLEPGDRVAILCKRRDIPRVEEALQMKMEFL